MILLQHFRLAQYRITFVPEDSIVMPETGKGNVIRGAFGSALKRLCCIEKDLGICPECGRKRECPYRMIFNPIDLVQQKRLKNPPRGFVIKPPLETTTIYRAENPFVFDMVIIGKLIDYMPWVIVPFNELGKYGIGKNRGKFALGDISLINGDDVVSLYDSKTHIFTNQNHFITGEKIQRRIQDMPKERITLEFLTPTRIKYNPEGQRGGSIIVKEPDFHHIIRRLLSRLSTLSLAYIDETFVLDYKGLIEKAKYVEKKETDIKWKEMSRKSRTGFDRYGRHAVHDQSGFIGRILFEGKIEDFLPLILLGEYVHVGEDTAFGNGWYRVKEG